VNGDDTLDGFSLFDVDLVLALLQSLHGATCRRFEQEPIRSMQSMAIELCRVLREF
jgi:hypothetical protein